jgi:ketosteroid isomerase-like protein
MPDIDEGDAMTDELTTANTFFDRYASALLARDEAAVAAMFASPVLLVTPGTPSVPATTDQVEAFFASSWDGYEGIDAFDKQITIMGAGRGSLWAYVTWFYRGQAQERMCYQLVSGDDGWKIAVLTPMA